MNNTIIKLKHTLEILETEIKALREFPENEMDETTKNLLDSLVTAHGYFKEVLADWED